MQTLWAHNDKKRVPFHEPKIIVVKENGVCAPQFPFFFLSTKKIIEFSFVLISRTCLFTLLEVDSFAAMVCV